MTNNYHLYIEFWSNADDKENILKIIERDFKNMTELTIIKDKIKDALGGKLE
jgi:hypothetical protein